MSDTVLLRPPRPSQILRPGVRTLPIGVERYVVRGGGALTVRLQAGGRLTVIDREGLQAAELSASDATGRPDLSILGAKAGPPALRIFGGGPAGDMAEFIVQRESTVRVAAPGGIMDFDRQDTATDLELIIHRATPVSYKASETPLPDPLRDSLQEIRIKAATARAYTVKAGEYIQITDVDGRQMTDFQCFSMRKLDKGLEHALDATVTRTLTGRALPVPGLPSKAFAFDFEPLVEVVQDTVGRHDAFATACNARYYDDIGYPRHVNCTENFNFALAPYGIARRKGWEALNFFYNTRMDHADMIVSDEAWSRLGDYVLLKARPNHPAFRSTPLRGSWRPSSWRTETLSTARPEGPAPITATRVMLFLPVESSCRCREMAKSNCNRIRPILYQSVKRHSGRQDQAIAQHRTATGLHGLAMPHPADFGARPRRPTDARYAPPGFKPQGGGAHSCHDGSAGSGGFETGAGLP